MNKLTKLMSCACFAAALIIIVIYCVTLADSTAGTFDLLGLLSAVLFSLVFIITGVSFGSPTTMPIGDHTDNKKRVHISLAIWIALVNAFFVLWALRILPWGNLTWALEGIWYNTIDANNYTN